MTAPRTCAICTHAEGRHDPHARAGWGLWCAVKLRFVFSHQFCDDFEREPGADG